MSAVDEVGAAGPADASGPAGAPPEAAAPDAPLDASPAAAARRSAAWPGRWRWLAAAVVAALLVGGVGLVAADRIGSDPPPPALGPGEVTVEIDVEHSLFSPTELRVEEGTRVRFVVVNGDPIGHELIVGPAAVHERHADGTEAEHPSIPGEVSVAAGLTAVTTYRFDEPGTFEFACHLPGHYGYGMHGEVEVVPS